MTGFGVGDAKLAGGKLVAEVRSVNQRFLDVRAKLPREIGDLGGFAEQVVRERVRRGRLELVVHAEGAIAGPITLDVGRAKAAMRALAELRDAVAPEAPVPLELLAAVPDLFTAPALSADDGVRVALRVAIEAALGSLDVMCAREGTAIATELTSRCATIAALVDEIVARADVVRDGLAQKMKARLAALLGPDSPVDAGRLEAEVAVLADKADVAEELARLKSHLGQVTEALVDPSPEPVGRRLDFLLQEMLREANTLGAKAQDALVSQKVVAIKVELERLREQVQNVE